MSRYTDLALERRRCLTPEGRPAWNCSQAVVTVFAEDLGYDEDFAMKAATFFRGGMQIGSVCGAVTGGLMVLGLAGLDAPETANLFLRKIRNNHSRLLTCKDLLQLNAEKGGEKIPHCNSMICECITAVEEALRAAGKLPKE